MAWIFCNIYCNSIPDKALSHKPMMKDQVLLKIIYEEDNSIIYCILI
jgi:hypothetical protein